VLSIDDLVLINSTIQKVVPQRALQGWFGAIPDEAARRAALRDLSNLALQAGVTGPDVVEAISQAGLKDTFTPCVLMLQGAPRVQAAKVVCLPANEQEKAFRLFVALLAIADLRRRTSVCRGGCRHWWHQDLGDQLVVAKIRRASPSDL
jgi:hypothetical protein